MAVPGSNNLNLALSVIARQTVSYWRYLSRTTNAIGLDVSTYADPVDITGSLQAVPRSAYKELGLDLTRNYVRFFTSNDLIDIKRDVSGDRISYAGKYYNVLSATDWYAVDGWLEVLCIEVPLEPGSSQVFDGADPVVDGSDIVVDEE